MFNQDNHNKEIMLLQTFDHDLLSNCDDNVIGTITLVRNVCYKW